MSKKVLIIGKVWPEPKSSAAGIRMMQLIKLIKEAGNEIYFTSTALETEFQSDIKKLGVHVSRIELNNDSFDSYIGGLKPDCVVFDRFMTEEQFGWRVDENCPNALKILNTEDLHFLRDERKHEVQSKKVKSDLYLRELTSIYRCDLTLLVSEFERELLMNKYQIPCDLLHYLPLFAQRNEDLPSFDLRKDFMFIGNFYHEPNWDAVKVLKETVWPMIRKELPEARLNIYGAYPGQKVMDLHNEKEGFIVHGRIDDADRVTKSAKLSLAPLRFGAGIKGKILEAMSNGTPCITTSIGAEAMLMNNEWCGGVSDDWKKFSSLAVELYTKEELWSEAQNNGFNILQKQYRKNLFANAFIEKMDVLQDSLEEVRNLNIVGQLLNQHTMLSNRFMSKWIMEKNKTSS